MSNFLYQPKDWFWQVGDDASRFWSSAAGGYVPSVPKEGLMSHIRNEVELRDVLVKAGLEDKAPVRATAADMLMAFDRIDHGATLTAFSEAEISGAEPVEDDDPRLTDLAEELGLMA